MVFCVAQPGMDFTLNWRLTAAIVLITVVVANACEKHQDQQWMRRLQAEGAATIPMLQTTLPGADRRQPNLPLALPMLSARRRTCSEDCYARATCNEELGRCDCQKLHNGPDCQRNTSASQLTYFVQTPEAESTRPMPCLNLCNGRGRCSWGECVCSRGFFGADCSLSIGPSGKPTVMDGTGYRPRDKRPYIYVYDIPHRYSSWHNPRRTDREAHWTIWQRMLKARVLVGDGDEADWYFIPIKMRNTADGPKLLKIIEYIRMHWPWYDRFHGHRHFIIHMGDSGRGEVSEEVRALSANMTWLHHWGLYEDFPYSGWKASHRPGKDIVIPISFKAKVSKDILSTSPLHPRASAPPRDGKLLFAGRICGDYLPPDPLKPWPHCQTNKSMGYSQGARQMVHYYHHNRTGYKIVTSSPTYLLDLMRFKWCLAPSGGGHGHRQTLTAIMGCLPVVVSDMVMQPFEPEMHWASFAIRVAQVDVPELHILLDSISDEEYQRMQDAVQCAAQHLLYSSSKGAVFHEDGRWDAFETILEILRMQQIYPALDPAHYSAADKRFKLFMGCGYGSMAQYGAIRKLQHGATYLQHKLQNRKYFNWDHIYKVGGMAALLRSAASTAPSHPALILKALSATDGEKGGKQNGWTSDFGGMAGEDVDDTRQELCSLSKWDSAADKCVCEAYKDCFEPGSQV